jgi:ankyrin repeat protein
MAVFATAVQAATADLQLVRAAQAGDFKRALGLVNTVTDIDARDDRGYSALMWAASYGDVPLVTALLVKHARTNTPASTGATAFSIAVTNDHVEVVKALIRAGSNCRALDSWDHVWDPEANARGAEMQALVSEALRGGRELLAGVRANDVRRVKAKLAAGAPVGFVEGGAFPVTPLMEAVRNNSPIEIVRSLLAAGAPVSDDNVDDKSPMDYLQSSARPELIQLLLSAQPRAEVVFRAMRKPGIARKEFGKFYDLNRSLLDALRAGDADRVQQALAAGADANATTEGKPVLDSAIRAGKIRVVRMLTAAGAVLPRDQMTAALEASPNRAAVQQAISPVANRGSDPAQIALNRIGVAAMKLPPSPDRERIMKETKWLLSRPSGSSEISDVYRRELEGAAEKLESPQGPNDVLEVADDLTLKSQHCRALGIGMGGKIRVSFTTRRNGAPVHNWQVFYIPKIFQHAKGVSPWLIPGWTSPSEEMLEPGRYLVWAQDPLSKNRTEPQDVPFSGRSQMAMDLAVP